jgi:hypothetical protein
MYFVENPKVYDNHSFLHLLGIKSDKVTTDPMHNGAITVFDCYHFNDTEQRYKIKNLVEERNRKNLTTFIIYEYSYETGIDDNIVEQYVQEMSQAGLPSSQISFILHDSSKSFIHKTLNKYRFHFLDHFTLKLYSKYKSGEAKSARKSLVDRKIAINILVAQLHWKKTRLHTLYHLYKKNLLQTAITGILSLKESIQNLEHEIQDPGFWQWLYNHLGPADDVIIQMGHDALISSGFPYSIDVYNNTRVSHVCETLCREMSGPSCFLTEKTYKPILNLSPFVIQGCMGHTEFLKEKGFSVFDKYIDLDYDKVPFNFDLIPKTVEATRLLLLTTIDYPKEIEMQTQNNFRRLIDIGKQELTLVKKFLGEKS